MTMMLSAQACLDRCQFPKGLLMEPLAAARPTLEPLLGVPQLVDDFAEHGTRNLYGNRNLIDRCQMNDRGGIIG
jgi:hypothetical protein